MPRGIAALELIFMKILIFGGTTEGRILAQAVSELHKGRHSVTVSVATPVGAHELTGIPDLQVLVGRLDQEEMVRLFMGGSDGGSDVRSGMHAQYDFIVDATHPYAVEASGNIRYAAEKCGIFCVRLVRTDEGAETSDIPGRDADGPKAAGQRDGLAVHPEDCGAVCVDSAKSAAAYLEKTEGRILLTTGSKELNAFAKIPVERLYVRVLPTAESIAICERAGISYRNTIAMVGPFTREMNAATMRQYKIEWMVTKDSGKTGGFDEKLEACLETGVRPVVIARPRESGLSMEEVLALIEKHSGEELSED